MAGSQPILHTQHTVAVTTSCVYMLIYWTSVTVTEYALKVNEFVSCPV